MPEGGADACDGDSGKPKNLPLSLKIWQLTVLCQPPFILRTNFLMSVKSFTGGPYVLTDEPDVQVGIVSWGQGCGLPGIPGVATQVSYYVDWIASLAKQV